MSNEEQVVFWNGETGARWVREQPLFDANLRVFGDPALAAAHPRAGEVVLDIGCGCGDTCFALADLVGPHGHVCGIDVSDPMLALARQRSAGRRNVSFVLGDAATEPLPPESFDLLFSRFGVTFFVDPVAAFTNLGRALKPSGRVAFVCWRTAAENEWLRVPAEAVAGAVGLCVGAAAPAAPGPFAFGDAERVRHVLAESGLASVVLTPLDADIAFGGEGGSLDGAVEYAMRLGPPVRLLAGQDGATHERARAALRQVLAHHEGKRGVRLRAACWIVSATRQSVDRVD